MSGLQNSEVNPYAPPKSEVAIKQSHSVIRRPKSAKWALAIFLVKLVVINFIHWRIAQQDGIAGLWQMYQEEPFGIVAPITSLLAFLALAVGWRSQFTYSIGSLALLVLCYDAIVVAYQEWITNFFNLDLLSGILGGAIPMALLSLLLFLTYRFIFGLASRRYYRVIQDYTATEP